MTCRLKRTTRTSRQEISNRVRKVIRTSGVRAVTHGRTSAVRTKSKTSGAARIKVETAEAATQIGAIGSRLFTPNPASVVE